MQQIKRLIRFAVLVLCFGYIMLYGGIFLANGFMADVDQGLALAAILVASIAAIIITARMVSAGKAARLSLLKKDYFARFSESRFSAPSIGCFASSYGLSEQETEILRCLLDGQSISYIAAKTNATERFVQNNVNSILLKTGTKTIPEATSLFQRMTYQAMIYQDVRRVLNSQ